MSGDIEQILEIKKKGDAQVSASVEAMLQKILEETRTQTRHVRAIRWIVTIAWLLAMLGAWRIGVVRF